MRARRKVTVREVEVVEELIIDDPDDVEPQQRDDAFAARLRLVLVSDAGDDQDKAA